MDIKKPKIVSLFSGAGGLDIGFDKAGMNSSFLAPVVEYGTDGEEPWEEPRPFMEATENELRNGELIKNIIKEIDYIK